MLLQLPLRGVSDVLASSERPEQTTSTMLNMRGIDPRTKQIRLAQRSGLSKAISTQVNGTEPVRALRSISFQRRTVLYQDKVSSVISPLIGDTHVKWKARTSSGTQVLEQDTDRQGNHYAVDGLAGVEKRNSAGELQWKLALPVKDSAGQVRALRTATVGFIDAPEGSDGVFAAVSAGGSQRDARMWCYKQVATKKEDGSPEIKTEQVWEVAPGAFVERIRIRDGFLYTAENEPDVGRSWVRIRSGIAGAGVPDLTREFEVPYPVNGMDVRDSDGAIITCHPPNTTRGLNPAAPGYSARDLAKEWTLRQLTDIDKRLWTDLNAATMQEELGIEDGDAVVNFLDAGSGFRSLAAATTSAAVQPTFVENGIGGLPAIRFSGQVSGLTPTLFSLSNPSISAAYDDQQRTILPAFTGCRWIMFIVFRPAAEATNRPAFHQDNEVAGALASTNILVVNKDSTTAAAQTGNFAGKLAWLTQTDATNGPGAGSASGIPAAAPFDIGGFAGTVLLTVSHDGNASATTDAVQHSLLRINGRPIDRYTSLDSSGLGITTVGGGGNSTLAAVYLNGDISRIIVLRDYSTGGAQGNPATGAVATGGTTHYPRTLGAMGSSTGIAWGAASGNRFNDNEIERIEGMLAGEYGIAHTLPCGTAAKLVGSANAAAGETVTIDGRVYTFRAALTVPAVADEILVGASAAASYTNLFRAINLTGTIGTDYSFLTTAHATVIATGLNVGSATAPVLKIETKGLTAVAVSETLGSGAWNVATTTTLATDASAINAYMPGHYPHPFNLNYGFPRPDSGATVGATIESKGKMLTSREGILARWDPNGKCAWVLTSRNAVVTPAATLPATNQLFGGIGYDCAFGQQDDSTAIYSMGPQCGISAATQNEQAVLRRVVDNGTSVSAPATATGLDLALGTWALTPSLLVGGVGDSIDYEFPRMAVDTFDNVYAPYYETSSGLPMAVVCVDKRGNHEFSWKLNSGVTSPSGLSVIVDRKLPDYDGDPASRAFSIYVGTRLGYTSDLAGQETIYKIEPVTVSHLATPPIQNRLLAVAAGSVMTSLAGAAFLDPSGTGTLTNPQLSDAAAFISTAALYGEVFLTDGRTYLVYNARADTLKAMVAKTAGELKPRGRLVCAWRGRLVWARFADSPHEFLMSALGDPYDYDISPPTQTSTQAVLGSKSPKGTGQCPDIINGLIPISDDRLMFVCETSIWILDGDPMDGGRLWCVSTSTGGAFGNAWCKDEYGVVYIMGTRGCVYAFDGQSLTPLSDGAIPERLRAINSTDTRVEMAWSSEDQGFHLFLIPTDSVAVAAEHYFWSRKLRGWYPDTFADLDMQPMSTVAGDGDAATTRHVVIGCADGYLRAFDSSVDDDDGEATLPTCDIGPVQPKDAATETLFKELRVVLANAQGGCGYQGYASATPDDKGQPVFNGVLDPGRNDTHFVQAVGSHFWLRVSNVVVGSRFAVESIEMGAYAAGQKVRR